MRNLVIGLLALGSISIFASDRFEGEGSTSFYEGGAVMTVKGEAAKELYERITEVKIIKKYSPETWTNATLKTSRSVRCLKIALLDQYANETSDFEYSCHMYLRNVSKGLIGRAPRD